MPDLFEQASQCIAAAEPDEKLLLTRSTREAWRNGDLTLDRSGTPAPIGKPGRPARPELVHPSRVRQRKLTSETGRAAFLHALAHIEFNAINLGWDAVYRFRDLPKTYYDDWSRVAAEEAGHFALLRERLRELGHDYGDFPAHDGLWYMARCTAQDSMLRMALVPRVLEARGLDVTPDMIRRLQEVGDKATVEVLETILRDEIGHVKIGTRWYHYLCRQRGLDPLETFSQLLNVYAPGRIRQPLNTDARQRAGFNHSELELLQHMAANIS
jgi:uncharacterized ferritin-like protein (DUF455 family)